MPLKVGELAKRTGISVRTLHHYDEIGLVSPSSRSDSGHRLYAEVDIRRLQQVVSLRSLGMALDQIDQFLREKPDSPLLVLELHLKKLQQEASERNRLIASIEKIASSLSRGGSPSLDDLLQLIEETKMFEKYYTQEQLNMLQERQVMLGDEKIKQTEQDWATLIAEVKNAMEKGETPSSPVVLELARQWKELLSLFTGNDNALVNSCAKLYESEGAENASRGLIDGAVFQFMGQALAELPE